MNLTQGLLEEQQREQLKVITDQLDVALGINTDISKGKITVYEPSFVLSIREKKIHISLENFENTVSYMENKFDLLQLTVRSHISSKDNKPQQLKFKETFVFRDLPEIKRKQL